MTKKSVGSLQKGAVILVGRSAEGMAITATVERVELMDVYAYHDAPSWCYVETQEFEFPFHFDFDSERVEVL